MEIFYTYDQELFMTVLIGGEANLWLKANVLYNEYDIVSHKTIDGWADGIMLSFTNEVDYIAYKLRFEL